jgi:hypothetical protein
MTRIICALLHRHRPDKCANGDGNDVYMGNLCRSCLGL